MTFHTDKGRGRRGLAAGLLVALLTGCVPPPEEPSDEIPIFDIETAMGQIQARGYIKVGVDGSLPPLSFFDHDKRKPAGLAVDLGEHIAAGLGVEPVFSMAATDDLLQQVEAGLVDIAFPALPITERALADGYRFSDPYYVAHQRLLVPTGARATSVDDLAGETVCSFAHPQTGVGLDDLNEEVNLVAADSVAECARALERGRVAAVTGPDLLLFGLDDGAHEVTGDQLTTEGFGVAVRGSSSFGSFVSTVFAGMQQDGRWGRVFGRWLGEHSDDDFSEPPPLTLEEAAALFPLADD